MTTSEHLYCDRCRRELTRRDGVQLRSSHVVVRRALRIADLCGECYRDLRIWLSLPRDT